MEVRFHPEAERELLAEVAYYEERSPGGERLAGDIEAALALVASFPEIGAPYREGTRRVFARRFPFAVVYRVVGAAIVVFAIAPFRRKPAYWRTRTHDE